MRSNLFPLFFIFHQKSTGLDLFNSNKHSTQKTLVKREYGRSKLERQKSSSTITADQNNQDASTITPHFDAEHRTEWIKWRSTLLKASDLASLFTKVKTIFKKLKKHGGNNMDKLDSETLGALQR